MNSLPDKQKINHKLAVLIATTLFVVVVASFFAGYLVSKSFILVSSQEKIEKVAEDFSQRNNSLNEEILRCVSDEGLILDEFTEDYDFGKMGISSQMFTSLTEMKVSQYDYKRQKIKSSGFVSNSVFVRVWEWEHTSTVLEFPLNPNQEVEKYFPIFIGYENYGLRPSFVSDISKDWKKNDSFTNDNGITFYFWYEYGPKSIHSVQLQTYWPYSPMGNPIFVQLSVPLDDPFVSGEKDIKVANAKAQVIKFAKDISFKPK